MFKVCFQNYFELIHAISLSLGSMKSVCFYPGHAVLFSSNVKIKYVFKKKGSSVVLKFLLNLSKSQQCCPFIRDHFLPFKNVVNILIPCQNSFFVNLLYLKLL